MPSVTVRPNSGVAGAACDAVVGAYNAAGMTFAEALANAGVLAGDHMGPLGGNANTLQCILLAHASTSDKYTALILPIISLPTDTLGLPADATITAVTLRGKGWNADKGNSLGMGFDLHVVKFTPGDPGAPDPTDYALIGHSSLGSIAYAGLDGSDWNEWSLPTDCLNLGGKTTFALVPGDWIGETFTGTWGGSGASFFSIESAENASPPELTVSYSVPAASLAPALVAAQVI